MIEIERKYWEQAGDDGAAAGAADTATADGGDATAAADTDAAAAAEPQDGGTLITDQAGEGSQTGSDKSDSEGTLITNTDKKDGEGDEPGKDDKGKSEKVEPRAPESYEDFEVPEGFQLNEESLSSFHDWSKEHDLTQEQAQAAIDYHAAAMQHYQELQAEQWQEARATWVKEAKADKEYGGKNFDENMAHVGRALAKFGDDKLVDALNTMGFGDHPALVRFFWKVGQLVGEADVTAGKNSGGDVDPLAKFYPSMAKK